MARRRTIHETRRRHADPGVPPNRFIGQITIDLRVVFPPHADPGEVQELLKEAYTSASKRLSPCSHPREYFDRSICPEPCNSMHYRCEGCGAATDGCELET